MLESRDDMSYSPTTPEKSSKDVSKYTSKIAVPSVDKRGASRVKHASFHEPSPASTYGETAVGDSVPATPQDNNDPAILSRSLQSTHLSDHEHHHGSASSPDARRGGIGNHNGVSSSVKSDKIALSQKPIYSSKPRYNGSSTNSSPTAERQRYNIRSPNWRRDAFVQESATQPDPFIIQNSSSSAGSGPMLQFRPREDRAGLQIDDDNAQAMLPPNACVFVANLSTARTDEQLEHAVRQKFSVFGTVYVKIRRDSKGMPFAFCQYEHLSDSERAIEHGRGMIIDGRSCRTERARVNRCSLYLSKIAGGHISEGEATKILSKYGALEKVWVCTPTDKEMFRLPDGIWAKFAFFQDCRDAQAGMRESTVYRLEQPPMPEDIRSNRLQRPLPTVTRGSPNRLYTMRPGVSERGYIWVGDLPATITQQQLMELFGRHGHITGIEIIIKHVVYGLNIYAFIDYAHEEEAMRAVGQEHFLHGKRLRAEIRQSFDQLVRRTGNFISSGSPRYREVNTEAAAIARLYYRALAMGMSPANAAAIFYSTANPGGSAHLNTPTPAYTPWHYGIPYYPSHFASYEPTSSNPNAEQLASLPNDTHLHANVQHLAQPTGQLQYPHMPSTYIPYQTYQPVSPYIYPPVNTEASGSRQAPTEESC